MARGASSTLEVETRFGPARLTTYEPARGARATLFLGHGAGGGIDAPDLVALAKALPPRGVRVGLVEQPYRVAGRRLSSNKIELDEGFVAVVRSATAPVARRADPGPERIFVGGRSAGARVAARVARELGAVGLVALAFPLCPPKNRPSRGPELREAGVPSIVVQGTRDAFGGPEDLARLRLPGSFQVHGVVGGDHGFATLRASGRSRADVLEEIVQAVAAFIDRTLEQPRKAR